MNYELLTIGNKDYKLVLTTRSLCDLEKKIGCNPIDILAKAGNNILPEVGFMVAVIWASAQKYHHGTSYNDAFDILDDYVADGHSYVDFIEEIIKIFKASGLITEEDDKETEEGKN